MGPDGSMQPPAAALAWRGDAAAKVPQSRDAKNSQVRTITVELITQVGTSSLKQRTYHTVLVSKCIDLATMPRGAVIESELAAPREPVVTAGV